MNEPLYIKELEAMPAEKVQESMDKIDAWINETFDCVDPRIQYASRESGIKAHAEEYSWNIESELFNQLTKEQQELWRKEIEQAVISGGYCGLDLANDERYDNDPIVLHDELVMCYNNGTPTGLSPYNEWWKDNKVQSLFKDGDKVKIVITKENYV